MGFWSTQTLETQQAREALIDPFDPNALKHGAYELAVGDEVFITSDGEKPLSEKRVLGKVGEQIAIPPGQFALLITAEKVKVPHDAIGFISIRASVKFRGLVNVSGFHVDPGYSGRLKFAVFNAGPRPIHLCRGERWFMIWFSSFDQAVRDPYLEKKEGSHNTITPEDVERIHGEGSSPPALKNQIDRLDRTLTNQISQMERGLLAWKWAVGIVVGICFTLIVAVVSTSLSIFSRTYVEGLRSDVQNVAQMKKEVDQVLQRLRSTEQTQQLAPPTPVTPAPATPIAPPSDIENGKRPRKRSTQ